MKLNIVPARTGILWVKLGILTFFRQPLALAGLFFMFFMAFVLMLSIPHVGAAAAMVLMPGATLGMMAASRQASEGSFPMPTVLVSAFRAGHQRARSMLILGAIYAVVLLALFVSVSPFFGAEVKPAAAADPNSVDAAIGNVPPAMFVYLVLQLPLTVLFAHAPALVHWHGLTPLKSLFFSAIAFWKNLGAFIVFGITWLVFLVSVSLLLNLLLLVFGSAPTMGAMVPISLFVMSIMSTSMYFTFRDSFVEDTEPLPPTEDTLHGEDR